MPFTRPYYRFLDGFRTVAMIWVLIHHMNYLFKVYLYLPRPISAAFNRFAFIGSVGVDIFFVISGFLISGLLLEDLESGIRIKRFYLRRFFKIFPQYILVVMVGIVWVLSLGAQKGNLLFSIVSYAFLFQNYLQPIGTIAHLWTIAVEEHFYFIYPLILKMVTMIGRPLAYRKKALFFIFLLLMILIFFVRRDTFMAFPYNSLLLFQMSHLRLDALFFGCMIKLMEPFITGPFMTRFKILPLGCFLLSMALFYKLFLSFDPCRSTTYVFAYLASGLLLIAALSGFRPLLILTENSIMRKIGQCSYGIYLWHYLLLGGIAILFKGRMNVLILMMVPCLVLAAGVLSTKTIEKYFLNLREKVIP